MIADTSGLLAIYDRRAAEHKAVVAVLRDQRTPLVVPSAILAEVDYLLRKRLGIAAELRFIEAFETGAFRLERFTRADWRRCGQLISTYSSFDLGLADSSVIATAERLGDPQVLTLDQRHFRAVESRLGYLQILPADA